MKLAENSAYSLAYESQVHEGLRIYLPTSGNDYHISRLIAASAQNIYASAGTTKEVIEKAAETLKEWSNSIAINTATLRTDIGTLADSLLYRLRYPVDELASLRLGATLCFMEDENPDEVKAFFTQKKLRYATGSESHGIIADPSLYAFFLSLGIRNSSSCKESEITLYDTAYFENREMNLNAMSSYLLPKE